MILFDKVNERTDSLLWAVDHLRRDTALGALIEALYRAQMPDRKGRFIREGLMEVSTNDLCENAKMSASMCSTRITLLQQMGLVKRRREGRKFWVTLNYEFLITLHHAIMTGDLVGYSTLAA